MAIIQNQNRFLQRIQETPVRRNTVYAILILGALVFFEVFNFSTTDFALRDLLGNLKFMGISWATTLAIAFCAIDFAGIARLFTPETGSDEPKEVWYLFGAWLLAATMNASLTWWGVSMAIANHTVQSASIIEAGTIIKVVPIFVAILVWVIRVLVIGTLSVAGDQLFHPAKQPQQDRRSHINNDFSAGNRTGNYMQSPSPMAARPARNTSSPYRMSSTSQRQRIEPTYHAMNPNQPEDHGTKTNGNSQSNTRHFS